MTIDPQTTEALNWSEHPAKERPGAAVLACVAIAAVAGAVWLSFGGMWAVASIVILVLALNRFFFPSRFSIDDEGITAKYLFRAQRLRWIELRRFVHDQHGGYLSRRAKSTRMDAYSGLHILFGAHRQDVIERIQIHLKSQTSQVDREAASREGAGGSAWAG